MSSLALSCQALSMELSELSGLFGHNSDLQPIKRKFKLTEHQVYVVGSTQLPAYIALLTAACVVSEGIERGFIAETGHAVTVSPPPVESKSHPSIAPLSENITGDDCMPGEEQWCFMETTTESHEDPVCLGELSTCQQVTCYSLHKFSVYHHIIMECLQSVCPGKYSQGYTDCAHRMAGVQADCLREVVISDCATSANDCILSPPERYQFLKDCLN